jgi:hypothetical protein
MDHEQSERSLFNEATTNVTLRAEVNRLREILRKAPRPNVKDDSMSETTEMTIEDARNLDDVVHELGIEDSFTTPAEAVRKLKSRIERLQAALEESVKLQSHYAGLLNMYDDGKRMQFMTAEDWLRRLSQLQQVPERR